MTIGFVGTGNMGGAILKGYCKSQAAEGQRILIHNRTTERNVEMATAIRNALDRAKSAGVISNGPEVEICNDNRTLAEESNMVIIGVEPKDVKAVLEEIKPYSGVVVSMAAGVDIKSMAEVLGSDAKIIRIMPNTPAQVGEAMTSMSRNGNVNNEEFEKARKVFEAIGKVEEVSEDMIHCVIGVSGSSPAYTYMYIGALMEAAIAEGMSEAKARTFAAQAVLGAAKVVLEGNISPDQLTKNVCSPGGATIEAVITLKDSGFEEIVQKAFGAAVSRSREMTGAKE